MKKIRVILVLGNKPTGNTIHEEFASRCDRAVELLIGNSGEYEDCVILSGGNTVLGLPTEARVAVPYLRRRMQEFDIKNVAVLLEEKSRTTSENIIFSQEILHQFGIVPDELVVIGRESQIPKVRVLVWRLWRQGSPILLRYEACTDTSPLWHQLIDIGIMSIVSLLDPYDRIFLYSFKKIFRNG